MAFKIFVDTDVIIDFLIDRQPHAISSSKIFDLSEKKVVEIFSSVLSINNVHYIIKRSIGDKRAREIISELLEIIEVLDVTNDHIKSALKSDFNDFEDAIQHSVALEVQNIKSIITRNTKDYKKSKISVFAPETFITIVKNKNDW